MARGKKKLASWDIWSDGLVDCYQGQDPRFKNLTNEDWRWIWPIRTEIEKKFREMMEKLK